MLEEIIKKYKSILASGEELLFLTKDDGTISHGYYDGKLTGSRSYNGSLFVEDGRIYEKNDKAKTAWGSSDKILVDLNRVQEILNGLAAEEFEIMNKQKELMDFLNS